MEWHRCSPHATDCAFRYSVRAYMLHELGANDPIQSCCGASPATPRREIASRACMQLGRLLAAEHSSEALPAFRHSSGSHCPLRGS